VASANDANHRGPWHDRGGGAMRSRGPSHGGSSHHGGALGHGSRGYTCGIVRGTGHSSNCAHSDVACLVCFKKNHTTAECWHKFDENYVPDQRFAGAASSYGVDTNWYADTGATNHITRELDKLTMKEKYTREDQIHTASGTSMEISHIGHSTVYTPSRDIHLNDILYVPEATKNLVSIHRLAEDNCVFVEFHPRFFFIKDQGMRDILLRGPCHRGLYPLPSPRIMQAYKQIYNATRSSLSRWHSRLGHPSYSIVSQVVSKHGLPVISESKSLSICDACQQGKSHQLPYPSSSGVSKDPLELIFLMFGVLNLNQSVENDIM
jgi:hypothetical protein